KFFKEGQKMKAKCERVEMVMSITKIISGVRLDEKDHVTVDGKNFRNLGNGYATITEPAQLSLTVVVEVRGTAIRVKIPIDADFRKRFQRPGKGHAKLTRGRMTKIIDNM